MGTFCVVENGQKPAFFNPSFGVLKFCLNSVFPKSQLVWALVCNVLNFHINWTSSLAAAAVLAKVLHILQFEWYVPVKLMDPRFDLQY